jgi:hypothetical protein
LTDAELTGLVSASHGFSPAELALAVVDGICEIESGKGILLSDAIQNSIRARNDMRARAAEPALGLQPSRAVVRSKSPDDSGKS